MNGRAREAVAHAFGDQQISSVSQIANMEFVEFFFLSLCFLAFIFIFNYVQDCVCVPDHTYMGIYTFTRDCRRPQRPEMSDPLELGVPDHCELPDTGAGNWKTNQCS